jgi:hypothetical protein
MISEKVENRAEPRTMSRIAVATSSSFRLSRTPIAAAHVAETHQLERLADAPCSLDARHQVQSRREMQIFIPGPLPVRR